MRKAEIKRKKAEEKQEEMIEIFLSHHAQHYCKIFKFIPMRDRFQYRLVSRSFNQYVLLSVDQINLDSQRLKMNDFKAFIGKIKSMKIAKLKNLRHLIYPRMYKIVQIRTLVGKEIQAKIDKIESFKFHSYSDLEDLLYFYPNLTSIEMYLFQQPPFNFNDTRIQKSNIKEIIFKTSVLEAGTHFDLQLYKELCGQLQSLQINISSLDLLLQLNSFDCRPNLQGLLFKCQWSQQPSHEFINQMSQQLQQFLRAQPKLQILYLNFEEQLPILQIPERMELLVLENMKHIKNLQHWQFIKIKKLIISSAYLTNTAFKLLFKKELLSRFDEVDITNINGAWLLKLWHVKQFQFEEQQSMKIIKIHTDNQLFGLMQKKAAGARIKLMNLNTITNLQQYYYY